MAASLKACTFNANGLSTLVPNGTGHEHRYTQIMKFFHRSKLHVMGLQEPHIPDEQNLLNLHEQFSKRDIKLLTNLSPKGRGGGAAILYSTTWTHVHSWTWSSRFLFVRLQDLDGIELSFAVCHFHHDATIRAHQWKKLA